MKVISYLVVTLGLFLHSSVFAGQPFENLQVLLNKNASLQANFLQQTEDANKNVVQKNSGYFIVKKPGKFFWETNPPFEQKVISNGSTLWIFDPDLEQVTISVIDERVQQTPALLLSGQVQDLDKQYTISEQTKEGVMTYMLLPKTTNSLFEKLHLYFNEGVIQKIQLLDSVGQFSTISLSNVKIDAPVNDSLFEFSVPKGVDIIKN